MNHFKYDLVLAGGTVVDTKNKYKGIADVAVKAGKIVEVAPEIDKNLAQEAIDVAGLFVLPGVIDIHVHLSPRHSGEYGHRMLAMAGVTTTLEIAGPINGVLDLAKAVALD
jgi:dihydroorotase-like cyclic amidohydrolase